MTNVILIGQDSNLPHLWIPNKQVQWQNEGSLQQAVHIWKVMLATTVAGQLINMLNWGAGLMLHYLYLLLNHLGGQNCVPLALSLGWWAGHLCRKDCAGNVGTPAQMTIGKPGPVGHGLEVPCDQKNLYQYPITKPYFTAFPSNALRITTHAKLYLSLLKKSYLQNKTHDKRNTKNNTYYLCVNGTMCIKRNTWGSYIHKIHLEN